MKICRIHIRSNGRNITGLQIYGQVPNSQLGTQCMLKIETAGSEPKSQDNFIDLLTKRISFRSVTPTQPINERLGEYRYFSLAEDEEFLGFRGHIDSTGITALGVIKWKPPKFY